jgi:hypothetical protein
MAAAFHHSIDVVARSKNYKKTLMRTSVGNIILEWLLHLLDAKASPAQNFKQR